MGSSRAAWGLVLVAASAGGAGCWRSHRPGSGIGETCAVLSTVPVDGATGVSTTAPLEVRWNVPVDPATVGGRISLRDDAGADVAFALSFPSDDSIRIQPAVELRFWTTYRLEVTDGVAGVNGQFCTPIVITFTTVGLEPQIQPLRPASVEGLIVVGDHAIAASGGYRGLQTYDVASPSAVRLVSDIRTPESPISLALAGTSAYAAAGYGGVLVFDVSNAVAPTQIEQISMDGFAADAIPFARDSRRYLAVAQGTLGVRILDVTDAGVAVEVALVDPSGAGNADVQTVSVDGELMAIADGHWGFDLARLSGAGAGLRVDVVWRSPADTRPAVDVRLLGSMLYVTRGYLGVASYDVTDATAPRELQVAYGPNGPCGARCYDYLARLSIEGGDLFAAAGRTGVARFGLDGVGGMTLLQTFANLDSAHVAVPLGGHVYAGAQQGLVVFDQMSASPGPMWFDLDGHGVASSGRVGGGYAYVAADFRGLQTFSLADPSMPMLVDRDDTPGTRTGDIAASGVILGSGFLVVGDGRAGITFFDLTNPRDPFERGNLPVRDRASAMDLAGGLLYACDDNQGIVLVDGSNLDAPVELSRAFYADLSGDDQCYDVLVVGSLLYVAGRSELALVDVSDPTRPRWVDRAVLPDGGAVTSLARAGSYLLATTATRDASARDGYVNRLASFDISTPGNPSFVWSSDDLGAAGGVEVTGGVAFVSAGSRGVYVFDVTNPSNPILEGRIATRGNVISSRSGNGILYTVEGEGGLGVVVTGLPPTP